MTNVYLLVTLRSVDILIQDCSVVSVMTYVDANGPCCGSYFWLFTCACCVHTPLSVRRIWIVRVSVRF